MNRRRVALHGATDEALALLPLLSANATLELAFIFDDDADAARARLAARGTDSARLASCVTSDPAIYDRERDLHAVIDASANASFVSRFPAVVARGVQIVTPLTARLLFGYGVTARDRKAELLQALHEIVESVDLTVDIDELLARMLEIAIGVTGAERGSLMLLEPGGRELAVRVAVGLEPELWPKVRVALGEGIAGRVAADARAVWLRGKADPQVYRIVRERVDVESALCAPLIHEGRILGVLNLDHRSRADAFAPGDLEFIEQLARLDAAILARAEEQSALRSQARRYAAVREVQAVLGGRAPLAERLGSLCRLLAERSGDGIASIWLAERDGSGLRLAATSLAGGGLGGEYRITPGEGIDGAVAADRRPVFLHRGPGLLAYAALPLVAGDALVGILTLQPGRNAPRGAGAEETLLEIAAAACDEIHQSEREARMTTAATKISALHESGLRMIGCRDPAEVGRLATAAAALVLEADHAVLRLRDDTTGRFVIRSYHGPAEGREQERLFRLDRVVSLDALKRRGIVSSTDLAANSELRDLAGGIRSMLAAPLRREGRPIGTLSLYDRVSGERFYPEAFDDDDATLFAKLVAMVERALANALHHALSRQHRSFDEETGLPNAAYLERRIDEEIARAGGRAGAFAVVVCGIEGLGDLVREGAPGLAGRVIQRLAESLRGRLRDFDVVARLDDESFGVLLPEPGPNVDDHVATLARHVAEDVRKDERLAELVRVALRFGHAVHGAGTDRRDALLARAKEPRIRTV